MTPPVSNPPTQPTVEEVVRELEKCLGCICDRPTEAVQNAISLLSALEKDAGRYRWLRGKGSFFWSRPPMRAVTTSWVNSATYEELDTAIDLARGQS